MSEYTNFQKDFFDRSISNIKNYQGEFDVTNLINHCLGIIIIPQQKAILRKDYTFDSLDRKFGFTKSEIKTNTSGDFSLKEILRHFRNGIAHGHIEQKTQGRKISGILIRDKLPGKSKPFNFEIEISVQQLKDFSLSLHDYFFISDDDK